MTQCYITLDRLSAANKNPLMKDSAAKKMYGTATFDAKLSMTRSELFAQGRKFTQGMSISGVQQKLSMKIDPETKQLVPTTTAGEYIIKPTPDGLRCCAEMEHLCMRISHLVGIDTALCGLIEFSDGEKAYITKRYDRQLMSGSKLHQEDLCSIAGYVKRDKYEGSYQLAGINLLQATGHKLIAQYDFFCRILLAYLIGNDDMHLKNLSVLRLEKNTGLYYDRMTPNYDVLCTEFYETDILGALALPLLESERDGIFSKAHDYYGYYTKSDFMDLADSIGLTEVIASKGISLITSYLSEILELIDCSYIDADLKVDFKGLVAGRNRAIQAERKIETITQQVSKVWFLKE